MAIDKQLRTCLCPAMPCSCAISDNAATSPPVPPSAPLTTAIQPASREPTGDVGQPLHVASPASAMSATTVNSNSEVNSPTADNFNAERAPKEDKGKARATDGDSSSSDPSPSGNPHPVNKWQEFAQSPHGLERIRKALAANQPTRHDVEGINGSNTNGGNDITYTDVDPIGVSIKGTFTSGVVVQGGVFYNIEIEGCILRNVVIVNSELSSIKLFNTHLENVEITNCTMESITCNNMEVKDRNFDEKAKDREGRPYLGTALPEALGPFDFVEVEWEKEVDIAAVKFAGLGWDPKDEEIEEQKELFKQHEKKKLSA